MKGNKPHVAYIVSMPHGLDSWTYRELEALEANGIDITVFSLRGTTGPYMPKPEWGLHTATRWGILSKQWLWFLKNPLTYITLLLEAIRTRSLVNFLIGFDFADRMTQRGVNQIHAVFGDHKLFVGYYCKKILKIPLSVAIYGYETQDNPNWLMFRKSMPFVDEIVVNCEYHKHILSDLVGPEVSQKARVVRHYAEIPENLTKPSVRILILGAFEERKGHDVLFKAIKLLGPAADNVELWVAGYGGPIDVEGIAHDLGIDNKVVFFGRVPDGVVDFLFRECDIYCLPSKTDSQGVNEGLPVALIEAMSYGKPVISTRITGIPELVEETLLEENDVEGLAQALKRLIDDPALREAQGLRNQAIVRERYSKQNVTEMVNLFL
jgi:colanic acid/amylovoran biosynthesis glycosyltransferase